MYCYDEHTNAPYPVVHLARVFRPRGCKSVLPSGSYTFGSKKDFHNRVFLSLCSSAISLARTNRTTQLIPRAPDQFGVCLSQIAELQAQSLFPKQKGASRISCYGMVVCRAGSRNSPPRGSLLYPQPPTHQEVLSLWCWK